MRNAGRDDQGVDFVLGTSFRQSLPPLGNRTNEAPGIARQSPMGNLPAAVLVIEDRDPFSERKEQPRGTFAGHSGPQNAEMVELHQVAGVFKSHRKLQKAGF